MSLFSGVASAIQSLFSQAASLAAESCHLFQRQRIFTPESLAQTFVLGHARNPNATFDDLAQTAAECGADVSPQAIDKRCTPATESFLKQLFLHASQLHVASDQALAPILQRFGQVVIIDSTSFAVPDEYQDHYPSCGGRGEGGKAVLKLPFAHDLRGGAVSLVELEAGKTPDSATALQQLSFGEGSLRISDLGYFDTSVFAQMDAKNEYFLSRLTFGVKLALHEQGEAIDPIVWLSRQPQGIVDVTVWLGAASRLKCRLIAFRVPPDVAAERRRKLRQKIKDERGCEPTQARLAWCDWVILVTNVPPEKLTAEEALLLYRARWQVELLFKRWKSQDLVDVLTGATAVRQMIRVWSRLLGALVKHWLILGSVWGDPTKSLDRVARRLREWIGRVIAALGDPEKLEEVLQKIATSFGRTCQRTKRRKKPGTFELLNEIAKMEYSLS